MGRVLAVIIWIITLLSVLLFVAGKWWFPDAISEHAPALDRQFMITIIVVGLAFAAAQIGLGWMVWKYRDAGKASGPRCVCTMRLRVPTRFPWLRSSFSGTSITPVETENSGAPIRR